MVTTVKSGTGIGAGGALNLIPVKVMSVILDTNHELAEKKGGYDALGTISYIKVSDCIKTPILEHPEDGMKIADMKTAKPLFSHQKYFPLKGEIVLLVNGTGRDIDKDLRQAYYLPSVNIWNSIHHNAIPNVKAYQDKATNQDYKETQGGLVRQVEDGSTDIPLGHYFNEQLNRKALLPYEGDFILEGRFGNSIRFGSTAISDNIPNTSKNNWSEGGQTGDPIIIIRNGQGNQTSEGWVPTIENINYDDSSIYLTSNQKIDNFQVASPHFASWRANIEPPTDEVGQLVDTETIVADTESGNEEENAQIVAQELEQLNASDEEFDATAYGSEGPDPEVVEVSTDQEEEMSMLDELLDSGDFTEDDFEEVLLPSELGVEFTEMLVDPNTGVKTDINIDVNEVTNSGNIAVPLLAQGDAKWKDIATYYNGGKYVIGPVGCCLLSCCMIASYYKGKIITPFDAAGSGGFTNSTKDNTPNGTGALLEWGQMEKLMGKKKKFHYKNASASKATEIMNFLISTLDADNPVLWETKNSGKKKTSYSSDPNANACEYIKAYGTANQASPIMKKYVWNNQHWMVIVGYNASADANSNPTFQVNDPSGAAFRPTVPLEHLVANLGRFVTWS